MMLGGPVCVFRHVDIGLQTPRSFTVACIVSSLASIDVNAALMSAGKVADLDCRYSSTKLARVGMLIWLVEGGELSLVASFCFISLVPEAMELLKKKRYCLSG
ncbi:hypothetical protein ILYODFUR_028320 [Ilyodon furcidens]|uniref:Uncharacterized protein n=1 Tax=Ilyodon furcidens TaxID=33524 RepID=A0ABV0SQ95_9TELE